MGRGLEAQALAAARVAEGKPLASASSLYVITPPGSLERSVSRTALLSGVPGSAPSGTSKDPRSPRKYSSSWCVATWRATLATPASITPTSDRSPRTTSKFSRAKATRINAPSDSATSSSPTGVLWMQ